MGEQALFFDGQGGEYTVTLTDITKKQALVTINDFNPINRALPFTVNIALVMSRGERMDYAIQKATELGVSSIQLLTSQHGEVRLKADQADKKLAHWQQVAVSACEQCGLNIVPNLNGDVFERCNDYGIRSLYKDYETSTFKVKFLVWKCKGKLIVNRLIYMI